MNVILLVLFPIFIFLLWKIFFVPPFWNWAAGELPGYRICWVQACIRAYSNPATGLLVHRLPGDNRHFRHTKTQPWNSCVSSALIPGHWGFSRELCYLKPDWERVSRKTHSVIHTFSLYTESQGKLEAELRTFPTVCVLLVTVIICFHLFKVATFDLWRTFCVSYAHSL